MVSIMCFHCRVSGFDSWLRNLRSCKSSGASKKKKKKKIIDFKMRLVLTGIKQQKY